MKKNIVLSLLCSVFLSISGVNAVKFTEDQITAARGSLPKGYKVEDHVGYRNDVGLYGISQRQNEFDKLSRLTIYKVESARTHKNISCVLFNRLGEYAEGFGVGGRIDIFELSAPDGKEGDKLLAEIGTDEYFHSNSTYRGTLTYSMNPRLETQNTDAVIGSIGVDRHHKRKGFAEAMLKYFLDFATSHTMATTIGTDCRNIASATLFEKYHFIPQEDSVRICSDECNHILTLPPRATSRIANLDTLNFTPAVTNKVIQGLDNSLDITTDSSTYAYQLIYPIQVAGLSEVMLSFDLQLEEGGAALGFLTSDQSRWMINKGYTTKGSVTDSLKLDTQNQDKVWLVITNHSPEKPVISKFKIKKLGTLN